MVFVLTFISTMMAFIIRPSIIEAWWIIAVFVWMAFSCYIVFYIMGYKITFKRCKECGRTALCWTTSAEDKWFAVFCGHIF